ncbi:MAG: hypothetical protein KJ052_09595 [Candidatus Hydrogenedentes bacterium]|nr:hypothetical protein [Candidatus Hydrogenedentota bacterium]
MVNLNLTLVVELVLFLIFLWVTNKIVFRPLLRVIDAREEKVQQDREQARQFSAEADTLEQEYHRTLTKARRESARKIELARREAQRRRAEEIDTRRDIVDREIVELRAQNRQKVRAERQKFEQVVPDLAKRIEQSLGLRGGGQ